MNSLLKRFKKNKFFDQYHQWYYDTRVWRSTTFLGVICNKSVSDLWNYQEIIYDLKPSLIVEFGTNNGGSALFFSMILKEMNTSAKVFTVEIDPTITEAIVKQQSNIELMCASSTSVEVVQRLKELRKEYPGKVFAILDSDHSKTHVYNEMMVMKDFLKTGDYLIVEDSNVGGNPVRPDFVDGPMDAINQYFLENPQDYEHDLIREMKFGFTFAPKGFLIKK